MDSNILLFWQKQVKTTDQKQSAQWSFNKTNAVGNFSLPVVLVTE